ncbi:flavin reductase family protein [Planctomonas psychrotolerans]|uniref:flavin reductase family protein n=1 Tax=Planctomonas psychrotolerans TaxID=2528712 RepID=UPI0012397999|nr:flavin reductase family protein [Planctomonas psychrotolerans]
MSVIDQRTSTYPPVTAHVPAHGFETASKDAAEIRAAFNRFPSGIAAVCAEIDGVPVGVVVSSFSVGVSFDPAIVMFSMQNSSSSWPLLRTARSIGISVLGSDQSSVASQLASRKGNRFRDLDISVTESGSLFLGGATLLLDCHVMSEIPAGDHHVVLLEVKSLRVESNTEPLVYHGSAFRRLHPGA